MENKKEIKQEFIELLEVMEKLRQPDGCPWDREQDHRSLIPFLIEEAYELVEAIEKEDDKEIQEELGDVLLQIIFHAQVAVDDGKYSMLEVIKALKDKLIYRHPHVFGNTSVGNSDEVLVNWESLKKKEKKERKSILEGVPKQLPSLLKAQRIQSRAAKVGFDWPDMHGVMDKVKEEVEELTEAWDNQDHDHVEEEFGDVLFSLVNYARFMKIRPEEALQRTITKFMQRFQYIEEKADALNVSLQDMPLEEMDRLWDEAKNVIKEKK